MPKATEKRIEQAQLYWLGELEKCRNDLSYFAFNYVVTRDEHDTANAVKLFPRKDYLVVYFNYRMKGDSLQFIAKSRQLMLSWAICVEAVWTALFHPHSTSLIQSKKFTDAAKLVYTKNVNVARCSFIISHLPLWMRDKCYGDDGWLTFPSLRDVCSEGMIALPNGAVIEAIPQGPEQIESRVPTFFASDEASLQDEWASAWAAAKPCLTGGGRGLSVATMRLPSDYGDEIEGAADVDPDGLIRGMAEFTSKNGVQSLRIHYTADEEKDPEREGKGWFREALQGVPGGYAGFRWQQHMEINPMARSGEPCLPMLEHSWNQIVIPPLPEREVAQMSLYAGFDWGARNDSVFNVYGMDGEGILYHVFEVSEPARQVGGILGLCALMRRFPFFERVNGRIWCDPSMQKHDQARGGSMMSILDVFASNGVYMTPSESKGQDADDLALDRLNYYLWSDWESPEFYPLLKIFNTCERTLHWWPKMRFEEWADTQAGHKPLKEKMKDYHVDQWDAFKYFLASEFPTTPQMALPPPPNSLDAFRARLTKMHNRDKRIRS